MKMKIKLIQMQNLIKVGYQRVLIMTVLTSGSRRDFRGRAIRTSTL